MAAEKGSTLSDAKRAIVFALCKRFSVDPKKIPSETIESCDIMNLLSNISKLSSENVPLKDDTEVMKWVTFATELSRQPDTWHATLKGLNEDLAQKAVLLGKGTQPSIADIIVFCALHSCVSRLSDTDMQQFANVVRWMDYIQNKEDFGGVLQKIVVNKPAFEYFCANDTGKIDTGLNSNKGTQGSKDVDKKKVVVEREDSVDDKATVELTKNNKGTEVKKKAPEKEKGTEEKKTAPEKEKGMEEKKKVPEKESSGKDTEINITILNIQVGVVRKAWKHPSADSLLVEEIDLGDGNLRQVVSGLAKYYGPDDLTNRRVVLITNVKPGKLRDVMSAGLVLCASNQDHSAVEPLIPPEGAILGECISFSGYDGKPEDVLNPKKKQLEKITPLLHTDEKGIATYNGVPFMTSAGPCTSSIPKASIK